MAETIDKDGKQVRADVTARTGRLLPPPVGTSDWARFSRTSYCVDKTLILKDLIDAESTVVLFTRPRRFGKTTMLKMIRAFYEPETQVEGRGMVKTEEFFTDKKIWFVDGGKYRAEQGKRPVIFLSFKDFKSTTWDSAKNDIVNFLAYEFSRFASAGDALSGIKAEQFTAVKDGKADLDTLKLSLGLLAEAVHLNSKTLPVILIDEYDQPITSASTHGYYDEMCNFMRVFLSGALKDNEHCHIGIMTGVLRVAKEGILSGLNNPKVWTVFESEYSQYFGFTEEEVAEMARYYGAEDKMPEIKTTRGACCGISSAIASPTPTGWTRAPTTSSPRLCAICRMTWCGRWRRFSGTRRRACRWRRSWGRTRTSWRTRVRCTPCWCRRAT